MGLREQLRRLRREARGEMISFKLKDGTVARFQADDIFPGCLLHESARGRRHYFGEDPGEAHAFVEALRNAADGELERLIPTQGTIIAQWLGEDEIVRGEKERTGPPVRWNDEGTVCE